MKTNIAMGLGALAVIVLDYVIVASIVGLLLLTRWLGFGWMLDALTVFLVSCVIVAWFYGKRFSAFLNRQDDKRSDSTVVGDSVGAFRSRTQDRGHRILAEPFQLKSGCRFDESIQFAEAGLTRHQERKRRPSITVISRKGRCAP